MKRATAVSVMVLACFGIHVINATYCKPLSRFKVDCNYCMCTRDGSKYTCTYKICKKPNEFNIVNDEGYEDDYIAPKKFDERIPYINDEIPSSREDLDEIPFNINPDDYPADHANGEIDPRFAQQLQDIDIDDQDTENLGLGMEDYRIRRDIFI